MKKSKYYIFASIYVIFNLKNKIYKEIYLKKLEK